MYLPCAQLGVQSLTFRTPLPKATERQLVHFRPVTSSLEGMQLGSYPAGRTWPSPLQLTRTTWLDPADAGPTASTTPATVPATATRPPASATRARMSLIELPPLFGLGYYPSPLQSGDARQLIQRRNGKCGGRRAGDLREASDDAPPEPESRRRADTASHSRAAIQLLPGLCDRTVTWRPGMRSAHDATCVVHRPADRPRGP